MSGHTNFGNTPNKDMDAKIEREQELEDCYVMIESLLAELKLFGRSRSSSAIAVLQSAPLTEDKIQKMFRKASRARKHF